MALSLTFRRMGESCWRSGTDHLRPDSRHSMNYCFGRFGTSLEHSMSFVGRLLWPTAYTAGLPPPVEYLPELKCCLKHSYWALTGLLPLLHGLSIAPMLCHGLGISGTVVADRVVGKGSSVSTHRSVRQSNKHSVSKRLFFEGKSQTCGVRLRRRRNSDPFWRLSAFQRLWAELTVELADPELGRVVAGLFIWGVNPGGGLLETEPSLHRLSVQEFNWSSALSAPQLDGDFRLFLGLLLSTVL